MTVPVGPPTAASADETTVGISVVVPVYRSTVTLIELVDCVDLALSPVGPWGRGR